MSDLEETSILTWTIENYSMLNLKMNDCIESPVFFFNNNQEVEEWKLMIFPNGDHLNPNWVSCDLYRIDGKGELTVDSWFELIDSDGNFFHFGDEVTKTFDEEYYYHGLTIISIEDFKTEMKKRTADVLIIKCSIKFNHLNQPVRIETKSKIALNNLTFLWRVEELDSSNWPQRKTFNCPEITLDVVLTIVEDDILISIKNASEINIASQCVTSKISLIDVGNIEQHTITDTYKFDTKTKHNHWKFPPFFTQTALKAKNCIQNGIFTLIFEFLIPNGIIINTSERNIGYFEILPTKAKQSGDVIAALQNDLKQMLMDKNYSDINLKADGQLFSVHKCLLSCRSPVFRAMFTSKMRENQSNVVDIDDIDAVTLDHLLKFLYIGTIDEQNCESTLNLMLAANKYQIEILTEKCAEILMSLLSLDNVWDIIAIADLVNQEDLKAAAMELIEEHGEDILSSCEWTKWSNENVKLALEISSKLALQYVKKLKLSYNNFRLY